MKMKRVIVIIITTVIIIPEDTTAQVEVEVEVEVEVVVEVVVKADLERATLDIVPPAEIQREDIALVHSILWRISKKSALWAHRVRFLIVR